MQVRGFPLSISRTRWICFLHPPLPTRHRVRVCVSDPRQALVPLPVLPSAEFLPPRALFFTMGMAQLSPKEQSALKNLCEVLGSSFGGLYNPHLHPRTPPCYANPSAWTLCAAGSACECVRAIIPRAVRACAGAQGAHGRELKLIWADLWLTSRRP